MLVKGGPGATGMYYHTNIFKNAIYQLPVLSLKFIEKNLHSQWQKYTQYPLV